MKTTGGTDDQVSIFDFYVSGMRTANTARNPILYLDKATMALSTLTYNSGISITGNIDGWVIVPFDAWTDMDNNSATTNRDWFANNFGILQVWQHEESGCKHGASTSDWNNKLWYMGDVLVIEDVSRFCLARQGNLDLPEGTLGYVMDVPETEQYINYIKNNVYYFNQWHGNFLMKQDPASEADPFNTPVYNGGNNNNGGGLYVKNLDGETYIVFNPKEIVNEVEYVDGTNDVSIKYKRPTYQTLNASNGKIFFNNISALENTSFTQNSLGLASSVEQSFAPMTHLAFRIRVVGGEKGQRSVFHLYRKDGSTSSKFNIDYPGTYFVDAKTGKITNNPITTDTVIALPEGDFDGYMVIPVPTEAIAELDNSDYIHVYTYASSSEWHANSDWSGRSLCFGDIFAVYDEDVFCDQFAPKYEIPDDTAIDILTVPVAGTKIYHTYEPWGLGQYTTSDAFITQTSMEENGERFFAVTVGAEGNYLSTYLPATYMNGGVRDGAEDTIKQMYPKLDLSEYNYIAVRFKITGGDAAVSPTIWINCGTSGATDSHMDLTGTVFMDYTSGKTTTIESGSSAKVPVNFDGWIIIPEDKCQTSIADAKRVSFAYRSGSWANRTIYVGDMKIVKDYDAFVKVHSAPEFTADSTKKGKIIITNTSDVNKNALYSVDGENWYNIDEFNALSFEVGKYTVTAKYPWSAKSVVAEKTVVTPAYGYKGFDGASYFMNVYDDVNENPILAYNKTLSPSGNRELGWPNETGTLTKKENGDHTGDNSYARLYLKEIDGETFIELDRNEAVDLASCANQSFNVNAITYGGYVKLGDSDPNASDVGIHSSIDKTNLTHLAIRIKIDELVEGASNRSGFYLYIGSRNAQTLNTSGAYTVDKDGNINQLTSSTSTYYFTGEFDGWIMVPFAAYDYEGSDVSGKTLITEQVSNVVFYMHGEDCHWQKEDGWDNKILYVGDMLVLEDDQKFVCEYLNAHNLKAVEWTAPTADTVGTSAHYVCEFCGKTFADAQGTKQINTKLLSFDSVSLTLEQNIAINFKANPANLEGFENVYAKFTYADGKVKKVNMRAAVNGKNVFTFDNIGPQSLGQVVTAQLLGTYNGTEYAGVAIDYSVKNYCYNKLAQYAQATNRDQFKTLLVDLLNYGAKAQIYTGTDTNNLVNADISYSDKKLATVTPPTVNNGVKGVYNEIDETVAWNGVNLYFEANVGFKFRFTAENTSGLVVKIMDAKSGGKVIAEVKDFTAGENGSSIAYFDGLDATQMRQTIYAAVYSGDTQVSEILAYSVLAYAGQKVVITASSATTEQKNLASLVSHMMRYGDSAAAYVKANS